MAYDLQPFRDWAQAQHLPLDGNALGLRCGFLAVPDGQDTTVSGTLCDHYRLGIARVDLLVDGQPVGRIDSSTQPPAAFEALQAALLDEGQLPYVIPRLVKHGEPVPVTNETFDLTWHTLSERVQAHAALLNSLLRKDRDGVAQASFRKFQQSQAFAKHPCDQVFYQGMREEFIASDYTGGLSFGDYYEWFHASARYLTPAGSLNDAAVERVRDFLGHRTDNDLDAARYWLHRNLEVHPRHHALFDVEVDRQHEQRTLEQASRREGSPARRPHP